MNYKFNDEFRKEHPETIGETDTIFDLENYKDWLEITLQKANHALNELTYQVELYSKGDIGTEDYFRDELKFAKEVLIRSEKNG